MIKNILRQSGVTLTQFANDLNISRPTLDSYIDSYNISRKISNVFYNDIFDFLFENPYISVEDFLKRYEYMREYYGMSQQVKPVESALKSSFSQPKSDYEFLLDKIKKIVESDRINPNTPIDKYYTILHLLTTNSKELDDFSDFCTYIYGEKKLEPQDEITKRTYLIYYESWTRLKDLSYIPTVSYDDFEKIANDNYVKKNYNPDKIKDIVQQQIEKVITENLKNKNVNDLDVDAIIELIKNKL